MEQAPLCFLMQTPWGYILNFEEYLELTSGVFDPYVKEEKSTWGGKKYSKPWDKEEYGHKRSRMIEEKRKAKDWKPGY